MAKSGLFISAFLFVAGAAIVWQQLQPVPSGAHSMTPPDLSDVSEGGAIVQVTIPPEFSSNAQIGKRVFDGKCADCHGANAAGQNGVAPPLVHKIYEPSHHGDSSFILAAKNGVRAHHWRFGNMPAVEGLTDADVKMVVAYVRELQRANGIN
ncbi:cytochrome c [Litoreibacter halocynthiae]|uniref:Cytochrome c n=1 Tax=Litoreibacter halocynthiae TaxID=1242689 RepID=A0A4V3EVE9_9RHOB|nr:cytochrome c [Litoreibacter halocynthiae]TDT72705.1 cytochrome c [Litoreibacter halocynthiae]